MSKSSSRLDTSDRRLRKRVVFVVRLMSGLPEKSSLENTCHMTDEYLVEHPTIFVHAAAELDDLAAEGD